MKEAAGRIWWRVLYYVRRERNDHAEAAEVLEEAVFSVSARLQSEDELAPIQNLDSYLFHSFVRRFSKRAQREDRSQYYESAEALDSLGAGSQGDWVAELENEILLKQVIGAMEPRVREMFALRPPAGPPANLPPRGLRRRRLMGRQQLRLLHRQSGRNPSRHPTPQSLVIAAALTRRRPADLRARRPLTAGRRHRRTSGSRITAGENRVQSRS